MPRYYENLEIGEKRESPVGRTVTETDIYTFPVGTFTPIHADQEYSNGTRFGGRLAQNSLVTAIMHGLHGKSWDYAGAAAYGKDNYRFISPVHPGDTVRTTSEVVEKREYDADLGIVTFNVQLFNQDDELCVNGDYLVLVQRE